ncbi:hypothetical protein, conserved [Eimeria tenella]|uniref:PH domain-containing protein n=1 Tax=Eimeria tenella TaxID=5802 RepID=H9B9G5_EIMTE|nr:hypothetical protein, conserved [Eimeria tenella]AET50625.1 hypothetical protein [Eimeria tenella]CDJ42550.1 hypothetical protein, conserved [Eimeria tenella]|eukprot:XP_013233300.1 hypothetical protein, conserved [Eimeria tenella]
MDISSFGAPLNSLSAFLDRENAEDEMPTPVCMDTGALRSGVLEKASKDASSWNLRRCALHPEAFWYSKEAAKGAPQRPQQWACIPLSSCVQILKIPQDKRGFLVQTDSRSYYWRAQSQNEAEAWLLSIGTQCAAMKEMELLRQAEARIAAAQQQQSEACVRKVPKENKDK